MKFFFLLFLVLMSCNVNELDPVDQSPQQSLIDERFQQCYFEDGRALKQSDSVLIAIFGERSFEKHIQFDSHESSMNCQVDNAVKQVPFGDSAYCVPNSYDLAYTIQENGKTIYSFRMEAGEDMKFEPVSTIVKDQLTGYQQLLEGNFNITYANAYEIAKAEGVDFEKSTLELVRNETLDGASAYHWETELENEINSIALLLIDTYSGEVRREVLSLDSSIQ